MNFVLVNIQIYEFLYSCPEVGAILIERFATDGQFVMTGQNYNKNLNCEKIFYVNYLN